MPRSRTGSATSTSSSPGRRATPSWWSTRSATSGCSRSGGLHATGLESAYLPGTAMHGASKLFAGDAKTDERDALVIAKTAIGIPDSLLPVPRSDDALDAARAMASLRDYLVACATRGQEPASQRPAGVLPRLRVARRPFRPALTAAAVRGQRAVAGARRREGHRRRGDPRREPRVHRRALGVDIDLHQARGAAIGGRVSIAPHQ